MVQFEEMIKSLELREVLLRFLELHAHPFIENTFGLNMDQLQAVVYKKLPPFTFTTGMITCIISMIFFQLQLVGLHYSLMFLLKATKKYFPSNENILKLSQKDQWYYTSYFHGSAHAVFGVLAAIYGLLYADGQFGTTWFHCNFYKLNMFDSQKYLSIISMGFFIQDFIFCIRWATKNDALQMQIYAHHVFTIAGNLLALWLGGFFGSCSQVSFLVEASTPFVSLRVILAYHKREDSLVYAMNGIVMTVMFFIFRVCFYYYMVFWKCQDFLMYRFVSFWQMYPQSKWPWCKLCMTLYCLMYFLNLFWFSKMLWGLMRGLGIDQAIKSTERVLDDEEDEEDSETDEKLKQE